MGWYSVPSGVLPQYTLNGAALTVLPAISCVFAAGRGLNNDRRWSQYVFHLAMTFCVALAMATPLAPEAILRPWGVSPVATSTLAAAPAFAQDVVAGATVTGPEGNAVGTIVSVLKAPSAQPTEPLVPSVMTMRAASGQASWASWAMRSGGRLPKQAPAKCIGMMTRSA